MNVFKERVIYRPVNVFSARLQGGDCSAAFKLKTVLVKILRLFTMRTYISHILLLSEIENPNLYCYARKREQIKCRAGHGISNSD